MNGASILIKTLIEQGVDTIFGYPGGTVLQIYDELYKNKDKIHHYITCHEQGAAHAADGYARATGKVGVCLATSGPGATNLVTGIAAAYHDSVPLVAITGNVATPLIGHDSFQEIDIVGMTMPIVKHSYVVKDGTKLADTVREAFYIAKSGRPGPVLIDIPKDIQTEEFEMGAPSERHLTEINVNHTDLDEAVALIKASARPFIYAGGGVTRSGANAEVVRLAKQVGAPVAASMMGIAAISGSYPYFLGMLGMHGHYSANRLMNESDLLIAIGVRFSDRATGNKMAFCKNRKILHIDIDPSEIGKNIPAYTSIIGDIKHVAGELMEQLPERHLPEWQKEIERIQKHPDNIEMGVERLNPQAILEGLGRRMQPDEAVATDVGQHQMWTAQYYQFRRPRTFITSGGLGAMGFGMGAAIGACVGKGKRRTALITSDGSFHMNLNELATAVSNELPLVVILMNNNALGMVRQWQTLFYDKRYSETTLNRKTDYIKLAESFGAAGVRVSKLNELEPALDFAFSHATPILVECLIDPNEKVLPMIPPGGSIADIILS